MIVDQREAALAEAGDLIGPIVAAKVLAEAERPGLGVVVEL